MPPFRTAPRTESRSSPGHRKEQVKVISACSNCKQKKVKCSGEYPCVYCTRRELVCSFPVSEQRRLYSAARVQELEARLALYEPRSDLDASPSLGSPSTFRDVTAPSPVQSTWQPQQSPRVDPSSMQSITADRDIGSSQDFGNRVQSLFEPRCNTSTTRATTFKSTRETLFPQTRPSLQLSGQAANELKAHVILPSEEDAFQLLDTIMLYFYEPQHLFDARDVSDRISSFFESGNPQLQDSNIWTLQIFLIFALGKLLRGDTSSDDQLPGLHYFSYVERVLPPLTELRKHGLAAIEVLALMVVYLQNADRKEDAAIYAGISFRLCTMHGLHRKETTHSLRRSETTHANRLWWTVLMLEKRLMIATGCPFTLDTFIDAPLPSDSPGFPNSAAMQINIQIAQIQTRIYSVIYGNELGPKDNFLASVREIISSLTRLAHHISHTSSLGASVLGHKASPREQRTSISLYTVLNTTIILTLRPIMLHLTKLVMHGETSFEDSTRDFQHLSFTCIEAARRSLELMLVSQKENMITKFGFFDLDTIFSAGFIMLLAEIIHATGNGQGPKAALLRPSPGISDALQLLEYLGTFNNQAAIQRRDQIQRIYSHISSVHSQSPPKESPSPCRDHTHQHGELQAQSSAWDPPLTPPPVNRSAIASGSIPTGPDATGFPTLETMSEGYTAASLPIEFPDDPYAMYSLYYDRDLNLTGGDLPDFEQLQRHFFGSDPVT